jgi:hypothetical protein
MFVRRECVDVHQALRDHVGDRHRGIDGYLLLAHGADTLGGYIRLLFLAFWSSIIGIASFALATVWLLMRAMTTCR